MGKRIFHVSPPPGAVADEIQILPFTYFDIIWLTFHPIRRLFFYEIPYTDDVVGRLRNSLSRALKHYFPLAGKILFPVNSEEKPFLRYAPGDSVPFTIFESDGDFDALVENSPRDSDQFYDFIPELPPEGEESGFRTRQVLAVQVTLFPNRGICIGVTNHHTAGDATTIVGFLNFWASISKLGVGGGDNPAVKSPPLIDRSLIKDSADVGSKLWDTVRNASYEAVVFPVPTNRVRATFTLTPSEIKKLKDSIIAKNPNFSHLSSFVVSIAYIWSCLAKSDVHHGDLSYEPEEVPGGEKDYFLFAVDCRSRLDPPLPENYFGNCVSYGLAAVPHEELVGDEGFFAAAESIAEQIKNKVNDKERIVTDAENWAAELLPLLGKRFYSVSGSAKVDVYGLDFGFGSLRKLEMLAIDGEKYSISLCKSSGGGLEFGVSLPPAKLSTFSSIFTTGKELVG
ncbi:hypothetical protein M569_12721 [Genlisea aurea]|uniref:Anthocyanin acyltransferase n=1 Tax=Genlisea aurea TaxID=192259 RepID=S8CCC2_9LAMI|nr:hypothetical protein M569_12721 [Genlisea aurea]